MLHFTLRYHMHTLRLVLTLLNPYIYRRQCISQVSIGLLDHPTNSKFPEADVRASALVSSIEDCTAYFIPMGSKYLGYRRRCNAEMETQLVIHTQH